MNQLEVLRESLGPVSYTHLDVYKRQDLEIIDAEKNPDMARQFGIMQAPTLVITDGEHLKKYVNASNIQKYVDEELD